MEIIIAALVTTQRLVPGKFSPVDSQGVRGEGSSILLIR